MRFFAAALLTIQLSFLALVSNGEIPRQGEVVYNHRINRPVYVLTERFSSASTKQLPKGLPAEQHEALEDFIAFLGDAVQRTTPEAEPGGMGTPDRDSAAIRETLAGCDITTAVASAHGPPQTLDEVEDSLRDAAAVFVVKVRNRVPALMASVPRNVVELVDAEIVDVLKSGHFGKVAGDTLVFPRRGGPVEILGQRYCQAPFVDFAQFEVGSRVLLVGWDWCDEEGALWCGSHAYPIVDGAVFSPFKDSFAPISLASLIDSLGTGTLSEAD